MDVCTKPVAEELCSLGETLLENNQVADAMALFEVAARQEPANGQYANNLAIARFQAGDLSGAVTAFEAALTGSGDRRLFTLNYADLARTQPRLLRRGLAVCLHYLAVEGPDDEVEAMAGRLEQEAAAADAGYCASLAACPDHAKLKVNGAVDPEHFVQMGANLARTILENLPELRTAGTVLDFGVGLGRVLWPLSQQLPSAGFTGFDVDPMMLNNLARTEAAIGSKLVYTTHDIPDNSIDAAYVISVFTHLDQTTDYWLWELNRVLAPGGAALVTYHDETLFAEINARHGLKKEFTGRTVMGRGSEGSTAIGTFYETAEWERTVGRFMNIRNTAPRGLAGHQSFSILTKRELPAEALGSHRDYIRDLEREVYKLREAADLEV